MEQLTDIPRINGLLKRVMDQRSMITIKFKGNNERYSTAIIELSPENQYLVLDELKPESGHALMQNLQTFDAQAQVEGIQLNFHAQVTEFGTDNGIAFYKIPIPDLIHYHQKRESVRIPLSAANPIPITLTSEDETVSVEGELADISSGGVRIRFSSDLPNTIQGGDRFNCSFLFPHNKQPFSNDVIIRIIRHENDTLNKAFIGAQFIDITKAQEREIQQLVMTLQRAAQQKRNA